MRLAEKMSALLNDKAALKVFLCDEPSVGAWVSFKFLSSYLRYRPATEPETFAVCPILLTQSDKDRWTPSARSQVLLERIKRVTVTVVMLDDAGYNSLDQPGPKDMHKSVVRFLREIEAL